MFQMLSLSLLVGITAFAQGEMQVYRGSIVAAAPAIGRIVLLPDAVVFLDDDNPQGSFFSPRTNVRSVSPDAETVTVQLDKSVRDRSGDTTRLIFRLATPAEAIAFQRWYGGPNGSATGESSTPENVMTFRAQRKKRFSGNTGGRLIIDNERLIFESVDNASESRRWDLKDIRELKHKNAYELEIRPFRGDKYELMLSGVGMDNAQFREIVDRVTKARTAR